MGRDGVKNVLGQIGAGLLATAVIMALLVAVTVVAMGFGVKWLIEELKR